MKNMYSKNQGPLLEKWLDGGLKQYGDTGSRPGLEKRIFANLRAQHEQQISHSWRWTAVAAVLFVAITGLSLLVTRKANIRASNISSPAVAETVKTDTGSQRGNTSAQALIPVKKIQKRAPALSGPRLQQFPSPRPLSSQEKLLLAYVKQVPAEEAALIVNKAMHTDELRVDDLEVVSLSTEPLDLDIRKNERF